MGTIPSVHDHYNSTYERCQEVSLIRQWVRTQAAITRQYFWSSCWPARQPQRLKIFLGPSRHSTRKEKGAHQFADAPPLQLARHQTPITSLGSGRSTFPLPSPNISRPPNCLSRRRYIQRRKTSSIHA